MTNSCFSPAFAYCLTHSEALRALMADSLTGSYNVRGNDD